MGSSDTEASEKAPKPSASPQDQTPVAPAYGDWSSFQAYSPIPPPAYFPSPMASGSLAQPYMWGPQPVMSPYGTPPHPYVMYPGGMYAHPSFPPGSHPFNPYAMPSSNNNTETIGAAQGGGEGEGKSSESKERSPIKNSKGSLGSLNMITGKNNNDLSKTSANGGFSHSGESGSGDSCEGSDANSHNEDSQPKTSGGQDSIDGSHQNGNHMLVSQNGVNHTLPQTGGNQIIPAPISDVQSCAVGPTTNLNIGMDYWGTSTPTSIPPAQQKVPVAAIGTMASGGPSEPWMLDERELKRQKRKQSNRESARRSRLRKQAECEELAQKVDVLKEENASLKAELNRIRADYEQLFSHNALLKEKLGNSSIDINGQDDTGGQ